ncbi:hypothetical protein NQ317_013297 [Molorchus minor]|uniref:Uncharacterized protein n=1 Tax=Molorchus minor TaxID=1323400 RepID=A0ABQ9JIE2_9CUCU|nr:hypothetical protein NQ317_013297 [Molorchus minor]
MSARFNYYQQKVKDRLFHPDRLHGNKEKIINSLYIKLKHTSEHIVYTVHELKQVSNIPCRRPVKRQTFNWNIQPLDICLYCLWSFYHQYFPKKVSKITYTILIQVKEQIQLTAPHLIMMEATCCMEIDIWFK